ncbi:TIR domain [Propionibacterium ruminifibrarum]|uniref:TIR domain n=1 Tax=Propionibacterium ruminifibrarum TaxID=1962131 RepID=A0A375HZT8_9ACTN|nr:DUF4143 domain-containing protein [Propionibacterium ruminifibrarum]SPF68012.1 TIR domain [Propionibacterium ruminifibrarum]
MPEYSYRPRAVEQVFATRASQQVAILEGRRAVGKSSLARHLVEAGTYASYQSLTEPDVLRSAGADPGRWVRTLELPAVIDEAQLVPGVSLAVKELVDELPPGHHFLLTGSASVGRGTMAGSDPLTGRSVRIRLDPFAALELGAHPDQAVPSIVDILFDAEFHGESVGMSEQAELCAVLRTGGIPAYCLPAVRLTRSALNARVASDNLAILGEQLLPGERLDPGIALRVLDSVLRIPAGQLNRTRLAQELGVNHQTISRYLGILERRFMITELPNIRAGASKAGRAAPKVHGVDSSLACEALGRAGHDVETSPELLGQTLETWVFTQINAARGWSRLPADIFYWRDNKTRREVDIVLVDGQGRRVGVEVKLATSVSSADLKGLRAMADPSHGGLHRGFVVYTGSRCHRLDETTWALPLAVLRSQDALRRIVATDDPAQETQPVRASIHHPRGTAMVNDGANRVQAAGHDAAETIFLSYVHADDDVLDGGITEFARQVKQATEFNLGRPIELVIDRDVLGWGADWKKTLQEQVARTTFLLAMVTPGYVRSPACQEEFTFFAARGAAQEYDGLLTLLVRDPRWDAPDIVDNPVCQEIHETIDSRQWLEQPLEDLAVGTPEFKKAARAVAEALTQRIIDLERRVPRTEARGLADNDDDGDGLVEIMDRLQDEYFPDLTAQTDRFTAALSDFGIRFAREMNRIPSGGLPTAKTLVLVAHNCEGPREELDAAADELSRAWKQTSDGLSRAVSRLRELDQKDQVEQMKQELTSITSGLDAGSLDEMQTMVNQMGLLSASLKPTGRTLSKALSIMTSIRGSAEAWVEQL